MEKRSKKYVISIWMMLIVTIVSFVSCGDDDMDQIQTPNYFLSGAVYSADFLKLYDVKVTAKYGDYNRERLYAVTDSDRLDTMLNEVPCHGFGIYCKSASRPVVISTQVTLKASLIEDSIPETVNLIYGCNSINQFNSPTKYSLITLVSSLKTESKTGMDVRKEAEAEGVTVKEYLIAIAHEASISQTFE